ncbi:hypothetical protein BCR43DRAFT_78520 [Syncephalastrum racemosum]|uniref:Uncharacterized protein n=1 Tax=Syncephalastrum racemosum TaxID=13706 RepID=A0A1X2H2L0_SYNRA|nr:hypothetical protein BCR43DRAFT_78520 [Syncephalastrum racemosum]
MLDEQSNFVHAEFDFVVAHSTAGTDFPRLWHKGFGDAAKATGIDVEKSKPDWLKVAMKLLSRAEAEEASCSDVAPVPSSSGVSVSSAYSQFSPARSSSVASSLTAFSTSSASSVPLFPANKAASSAMLEKLEHEQMWKLASGKVVEGQMKTLAMSCQYEEQAFCMIMSSAFIMLGFRAFHGPSRSLILGVTDQCYRNSMNGSVGEPLFSSDDIEEIRAEHALELPKLPQDLEDHLMSYLGKHTLDEVLEHRARFAFHPQRQADLHWVH